VLTIVCLGAVLFGLSAASAKAPVAAEKGVNLKQATEQLTKLENEVGPAMIKKDVAFFEKMLADSYVFTGPDGSVSDKKGEIAAIKDGKISFEEMKMSDLHVQLNGQTAVVTGKATIKGKAGGHDASGDYRFTDVFTHSGNGWKCIASQVTRVHTATKEASRTKEG
jgi:ketosteroid isomerase-like protein